MEASNTTPTTTYWICPLYSFDCYSENVDLAEGIQIKHAPKELREYIAKKTRHLYGRWDDPSEFDWAAFLPYQAEVVEESGDMDIREEIRENIRRGFEEHDRAKRLLIDLVTALRLCHQGMVTVGPLIHADLRSSNLSVGGTTVWTSVSKTDSLHQEPKYAFHQSDTPHVNELVKNLHELYDLGKLDSIGIALGRFHSAYHGPIEDRLIDQMIAFESLYLGGPQELTYKLALRVAFLLGKTEDKRDVIFSDMKKAYNYRSRIVHGDTKVSREELREIVSKTEEYLRQSIRRFLLLLSQGHTLKEIREKLLDKNILKNGKFLTS